MWVGGYVVRLSVQQRDTFSAFNAGNPCEMVMLLKETDEGVRHGGKTLYKYCQFKHEVDANYEFN